MKKQPVVYILASKPHGTLYIGVTSDLVGRVWKHKTGAIEGFTKKYNVHCLVYFECHRSMEYAIAREKELKRFGRAQKIALIQNTNPRWLDLYSAII